MQMKEFPQGTAAQHTMQDIVGMQANWKASTVGTKMGSQAQKKKIKLRLYLHVFIQ